MNTAWQPISNAPRDGRDGFHILVRDADWNVSLAEWHEHSDAHEDGIKEGPGWFAVSGGNWVWALPDSTPDNWVKIKLEPIEFCDVPA